MDYYPTHIINLETDDYLQTEHYTRINDERHCYIR